MTSFEIAIVLVLVGYGITFGIVCAGLFSRTRRNKSGIEITNKVLDCHNMRIDGIVDRMDSFVRVVGDQFEDLKKEDTDTKPKAGYGRVFTLNRASMPFNMMEERVTVYTVDDLKAIWDKYGHSTKAASVSERFSHNRLIIDFDENQVIIYDNWVE